MLYEVITLDADRVAETLAVLENLAREHQVLLSTHNEGVIKRAGAKRWHVVSLDDVKSSRNRMNGESVITSYSIHYTKLYDSGFRRRRPGHR